MRVAYFDCFNGVSGDMILGALLDAGLKKKSLEAEYEKLGLGSVRIRRERVSRCSLAGSRFHFACNNKRRDLASILKRSKLDEDAKEKSMRIFGTLQAAERAVHGSDELHELGETDTLIDIVGAVCGLKILEINEIYASRLPYSRGFVNAHHHGELPVPAPVTANLMKGVEVDFTGVEHELVTPTGIAILRTLAKSFGNPPSMKIDKIGYGAGSADLNDRPNLLRIVIGEKIEGKADEVLVLETNIDDSNPQCYELLFERLFAAGALDVYLTPVVMKKSRPGVLLTVLLEPQALRKISSVIFEETTTFGMRYYRAERIRLERKSIGIKTKFGPIKVKLGRFDGAPCVASPEYDDLKDASKRHKVPFRRVYEETKRSVGNILTREACVW